LNRHTTKAGGNKRKSASMLLIFLLSTLLHAQTNAEKAQLGLNHREDPDKILARAHQRLLKLERFISPKPFIFVGEIIQLGPHCQGMCICKGAISQTVDFNIDRLLLGERQEMLVHTSYVNCSSSPLPSPPFTLHEKLIIYCEQQPRFVRCFDPVKLTDERLKAVRTWISAIPRRNNAPDNR
jgi:hypothetical protein